MGEKALVESHVSDAINLVRKFDKDQVSPTFVTWFFYDDVEEWRLLIAGPYFDKLLPKDEAVAYQTVAEAMRESELSSISIADVKLVRTDSPLPQTIRWMINTPPQGFARAHLTDNYVNGIFMKELYVLRSAVQQHLPGGGTWSVGKMTI